VGQRVGRSRWSPQTIAGVPSGLIIFDGVCVFCSRWVRFVIARDVAQEFRFLTIQSEAGRGLAERLGIDPNEPETNAVVLDGVAYMKSDAALLVLAQLPRWRWAGALRLAPRLVRDWVYDRVARNRYRIFGRTEVCMVPGPEIRARFM
jgi:predicted DCC family thiol-disulfide oxidoreductase YuxK